MHRILLLRHGQSEWNALGRWQGQADPPLSPLGRRQAAHAASRLAGVDALVASDLHRARETATIIGTAIGRPQVTLEPAFRERHAGPWQGLTRDEIDARWPGYLADRRRPDGFESDEDLLGRVQPALDRLLDRQPGETVVVCHGGVVYTIEHLLGAPFERLPNLAGRWLEHDSSWSLGDRVVLVDEGELTVPGQI